jgi:hypothetical protein
MKTGLTQSVVPRAALPNAKELFRARFQRSLRSCVRRRFSVPECFGVIWLEVLEEIALSDEDQCELYDELIDWAKSRQLNPAIAHAPVYARMPLTASRMTS